MSIPFLIPMPLQPECGGKSRLDLSAKTVRAGLEQIEASYPSLYRSICDETGAVRQHMNVFVNNDLVRLLPDKLDTVLNPDDVVMIMPSVSGG